MRCFVVFCGLVVVFRIFTGMAQDGWARDLANFSPLAALFLCGGLYLDRRWLALAAPLAALVISDTVLSWHFARSHPGYSLSEALFGLHMLSRYGVFAAMFFLGVCLRHARSMGLTLGLTVAGSVLFYFVTNTGSWLTSPGYAKTLAGWVQCMTVGLPGFPPTLVFFRNTLVGDLFFSSLFVLALHLSASRNPTNRPDPAGHKPIAVS